jgi:hypothetical protein
MNRFYQNKKKRPPLRAKRKFVSEAKSHSDNSDDSDYQDDLSFDSDDCNINANEEVTGQLTANGLDNHLKSKLCNKSDVQVKSSLNRFARFFFWLYLKLGIIGDLNVLFLINTLILEHFQLIPIFYCHLQSELLLSASTVLTYNEEIQVLVHWFVIYRISKSLYSVNQEQLYGINLVLRSMRKIYTKERKRHDCHSKRNTVEGLLKENKWPIGGFKQLVEAVENQMDWARRVCVATVRDSTVYTCFMQLLSASFYTGKV